MSKSVKGCTHDEMKRIEGELQSRGFVKVDQFSKLRKGEYKVTWFSGSTEAFKGDTKFNIEWQE